MSSFCHSIFIVNEENVRVVIESITLFINNKYNCKILFKLLSRHSRWTFFPCLHLVKWSTVVYFYIVMLCLSEAFIQSCMFIPNYMYHRSQNIECLEYWTARDMTHGCIFKPKNLEFTGRTKNVLDEYLITVNTTDHITMVRYEW